MTIKDKAITFFPIKKYNIDYLNIQSFTLSDVIPHKCSISKGSHTPTMGLVTIKYKNKKKDEFMFHNKTYYFAMAGICSMFLADSD